VVSTDNSALDRTELRNVGVGKIPYESAQIFREIVKKSWNFMNSCIQTGRDSIFRFFSEKKKQGVLCITEVSMNI
jgi:hypothetical protein